MEFTDFLENELLDHVFRNAAYTPPAAVYLALFTVAPTDSTAGTEVSGGSYARAAITFSAASGGQIDIASAIEFAEATASWGTIVAVGILDASSGGNLLAFSALDSNVAIASGDIYRQTTLTVALD